MVMRVGREMFLIVIRIIHNSKKSYWIKQAF